MRENVAADRQPELCVIIPALNAAARLPATIAALRDGAGEGWGLPVSQVILSDGGSDDETVALARRAGLAVFEAPRGRGQQMAACADFVLGGCGDALSPPPDWLLFLHADTVLQPGWAEAVQEFMSDIRNAPDALPRVATSPRAAAFRFKLDDASRAARRVERLVAWRCRRFGLPYGDQGLLISAEFYRLLGGYRAIPLMEDIDLVRRIGRRQMVMLVAAAVTSAARYRFTRYGVSGYMLRPVRNMFCLLLYFLRVPPSLIRRLYG